MSNDNGITINLKTLEVTYYQGDSMSHEGIFDTLEEAVMKAKELQDEYCTEYGTNFINS